MAKKAKKVVKAKKAVRKQPRVVKPQRLTTIADLEYMRTLRARALQELEVARDLVVEVHKSMSKIEYALATIKAEAARRSADVDDIRDRMKNPDATQLLLKMSETERRMGRLEGLLIDLPTL